jgi:hypothetical protein
VLKDPEKRRIYDQVRMALPLCCFADTDPDAPHADSCTNSDNLSSY